MAQYEDITPAGYDFSKSNIGISAIPDGNPWNNWNVSAPSCFDNAGGQAAFNKDQGLIVAVGPNWKYGEGDYFQELLSATSYVNLGGEVGRVLCIYGHNKQSEEYDFNTYYETNIPHASSGTGSGNLNFFMDPNNTPTAPNGNKDIYSMPEHIRVRVVLNIYDADAGSDALIGNMYCVNNDGSQNPNDDTLPSDAPGREITCDNFYDADTYEWYPGKWLVYEFDTFCPATDEKGTVFSPLRLKMELSEGVLAHCVLFIKEVKFFKSTDKENLMPGNKGRIKSFVDYTYDLSAIESAIHPVKAMTNGKTYDLAGRETSGKQSGIYIKNGKKVVVK